MGFGPRGGRASHPAVEEIHQLRKVEVVEKVTTSVAVDDDTTVDGAHHVIPRGLPGVHGSHAVRHDDTNRAEGEGLSREATADKAGGGDLLRLRVHALSLMHAGQQRNPCLCRLLYQHYLPWWITAAGAPKGIPPIRKE